MAGAPRSEGVPPPTYSVSSVSSRRNTPSLSKARTSAVRALSHASRSADVTFTAKSQ